MLKKIIEKNLDKNNTKYFIKEESINSIIFEIHTKIENINIFNKIIKLVRASPFDKNKKIHTSLCSIETSKIKKEIEVQILDKDLKWDFFKSTGPGGQHKNKTLSSVRLIHSPTNTMVISTSDRSQHKNKAIALEQLKIKLQEKEKNLDSVSKKNDWENIKYEKDSDVTIYMNHGFVVNEMSGDKSFKIKDFFAGKLDIINFNIIK